jgi:FAD/FMN-containing dehydrogenase
LTPPFDNPASHYVLLEVENARGEELDAWLVSLMERRLILDGTLAADLAQQRSLWTLREGISESLTATGVLHKNDIALPIAGLSAFCDALDALLADRYPGWELCVFGHIGDGNLHVNVMKPDALSSEAFLERTHDVDRELFELVRAHQGSISAEHGIGLLKKPWLAYSRTATELMLMRELKNSFDPNGIMNPGKVF